MKSLSRVIFCTVTLLGLVAGTARSADHWSFQPVVRHVPPAVRDPEHVRNPIDNFILARLDREGISPSAEADRVTLIRRLSLDLRGLPPTRDEVERFLTDTRGDAYDRLVDRMLASPHFGERWGRHWLDLARYADSNGYTRDFPRNIWKYRDWVIDAFNRDLPFDRFAVEQLAGDMLPDATREQIIATGFHRNTLINEEGGTDDEQFRVDAVADRVDTTGAVFLGLTVGCARCHDHKFDPLAQREYYQFFAFLNNCDEPIIDAPSDEQLARGDLAWRTAIRKRITALEKSLDDRRDEFIGKQVAWEKSLTPQQIARLPGPVQEALMTSLAERTEAQEKQLADLYKKTDDARRSFQVIEEIAQLRASEPIIPTTMVMKRREKPRETHVHKRGNFLDRGERVQPNVPKVLPPLPDNINEPTRLDFAEWLVDPANPLTPRVIVNRLWQRLFGRGIVETENDFGTQGSPPTHPELLDRLAAELIARDWSIKSTIRLMVTSATYRQASHHRPDLSEIDPANRLLARQSRLRLEAEIVRDAALSASGLLSAKFGGPSVFPPQPPGVFEFTQDPKPWKTEAGTDRYRRGMYTHIWRSSPYPALVVFDFPGSNVTCTRRVRSNTPLQALTLANDTTYIECAQGLARRTLVSADADDDARIRYAFQCCLSREPTPDEHARLATLLDRQRNNYRADRKAAEALSATNHGDPAEQAAWTAVSRVILNLDEFITRE
jgi:hypothetical protein